MKQFFYLCLGLAFLLSSSVVKAQSNATDFQVKDCAGIDRHLFAELDAGKVIVLSMVHPCISCVSPTKTAIDVVNTYATSHPGKVLFYLTDDVGNTPCTSLNSWASTYGITGVTILSDPKVTQSDYGSSGMPKILVLAGSNHKVILNKNDGINSTELNTSILSGLSLSALDDLNGFSKFNLYPNPCTDKLQLSIEVNSMVPIQYQLIDLLGKVVYQSKESYYLQGKHTIDIPVKDLGQGIYFFKLSVNQSYSIQKVWITQ